MSVEVGKESVNLRHRAIVSMGSWQRWTFLIPLLLLILSFRPALAQSEGEASEFSYALKLFNEGFYDIAAKQFSTFVNRYPTSSQLPEARYYLAESLFRVGDYQQARVEFQALALGYPQHSRAAQAWKRLGECYLKLNNLPEAAKAFESIKILYPDNPLAPVGLLEAARIHLQMNDLNRAQQVLREFLDRYVESSQFLHGLLLYGQLLLRQNDLEGARTQFQKVKELASDPALQMEASAGLARVFQKLGFPNRAIQELQATAQKYPRTPHAFPLRMQLADLLLEQRRPEEALAVLQESENAFSASRQKRAIARRKVQAYYAMADYFSARKVAESFLQDDSLALLFQFYRAACLEKEQKPVQAIEAYQNLLSGKWPEPLAVYARQARINLYNLLLQQGELMRAETLLKALLNESVPAEQKERLLAQLIQKALESGEGSLAERWYPRFVQEFPESPLQDDLIFALGKSYFFQGKFELAHTHLQKLQQQYFASEWIDSAQVLLAFLQRHLPEKEQVGLAQLTRLLGRMLLDEPRDALLFDLGLIYLHQLKDYARAVQIFRQTIAYASDSTALATSHYYLAEAYLRWWEQEQFLGRKPDTLLQQVRLSLKQAMSFLDYAPHPDSLVFRYLTYGLNPDTPPGKKMEFWEHFIRTYLTSPLRGKAGLILARLYARQGQTQEALALLERIGQEYRSSPLAGEAYWQLAQLHAAEQNLEKAIQTMKDFLLEFPRHRYQARGFWQLASWLEKQSQFLDAARAWQELLSRYPYYQKARFAPTHIAQNYVAAGEFEQALAYIEAQLPQQPPVRDGILQSFLEIPNPEFYYFAGKAYFEKNQFVQARRYFFAYLQQAGEHGFSDAAHFHLGKMAYLEKDYDTALLYFSLVPAQSESPYYREAQELSANILFQRQQYARAREIYQQLLPGEKELYYRTQILKCLLHENRLTEFKNGLRQLEKLGEEKARKNALAELEFEQARINYQAKNFDRAIRHCETILKKYRETEFADDALYYIALSYTTLNRSEKALEKLSEFLRSFPQSPLVGQVYITMGTLYFRADKRELALDAYRKALEVSSDELARRTAMSNLIRMYQDLGLWDGALKLARQYVQEFPRAEDAFDKRILIGVALIRMNQYAEAIDYLKKLKLEASPDQEPEIQFYIGEAYFNAGQYEDAIREFVKIPLLSKKTKLQWEASALYFSGQAYERLGRREDAIRMYQEIINRPGILIELKREARRKIEQLQQGD